MAVCGNCGKGLGLFERKQTFKDEKGQKSKWCSDCTNQWHAEEEERQLKERQKNQIKKAKEEKRRRKKRAQVLMAQETKRKELIERISNNEVIQSFAKQNVFLCLMLDTSKLESIWSGRNDLIAENVRLSDEFYFQSGCEAVVFQFTGKEAETSDFRKMFYLLRSKELDQFRILFSDRWTNHIYVRLCKVDRNGRFNPSKGSVEAFYDRMYPVPSDIVKDAIETYRVVQNYLDEAGLHDLFVSLLDYLIEEYGPISKDNNLDTPTFLDVLNSIASTEYYSHVKQLLDGYDAGEVFDAILQTELVRLDAENKLFNARERIVATYLQNRGILKDNNISTLTEVLSEHKKKVGVRTLKFKVLESESQSTSIEDVDLMNGFEFEGFLAVLFKNMGYQVEQTNLSGDQGADLILSRNGNRTVIQAKCYSGKIGNKAVQETVASLKYYDASSGMVVTNSSFTEAARRLADKNDVRLIDRGKLSELIAKYS